jgi:hypothetical protein
VTFLDLVRKVGELGRAKCHPDCDIVVHRREAAMYMGVLRENPELLRELAAQPPTPADDTATVLAGLREEMRAFSGSDFVVTGAEVDCVYECIALVEAAQQRLAERGQGGGSHG